MDDCQLILIDLGPASTFSRVVGRQRLGVEEVGEEEASLSVVVPHTCVEATFSKNKIYVYSITTPPRALRTVCRATIVYNIVRFTLPGAVP